MRPVSKPRFPIGTVFLSPGKFPRMCMVTDILRTYSISGDLVKVRYVAEHSVLGRTVEDVDVPDATVARGIEALEGRRGYSDD